MRRNVVLVGALAILILLAFLTLQVALTDGIDVLVAVSFLVIALVAVAVVGALTAPDE